MMNPSGGMPIDPAAMQQSTQDPSQGAPQEGGMEGSDDITKSIDEHMNSLPDDAKKFLADYLTPEFAQALGILLGPEAGAYFMKYTDPTKILVPLDRKKVQATKNSTSTQPQAVASAQPQAQAPAAPQQGMMAAPQ